MPDEILRCPYCVLGYYFRPMLEKLEGRFICTKCGHSTIPRLAHFLCHCKKCQEMNRAA
jgi:ribosomal protein L37AE/L43A